MRGYTPVGIEYTPRCPYPRLFIAARGLISVILPHRPLAPRVPDVPAPLISIRYPGGEQEDVPVEVARALTHSGIAELASPLPAIESTALEPSERAVLPRPALRRPGTTRKKKRKTVKNLG